MLQMTLSSELTNAQIEEFEQLIPVQLAQPPWNYTRALNRGIKVYVHHSLELTVYYVIM